MAFGCAPLYIRLAAFLSAVNPSVSLWQLVSQVTLEPPTNLQLQQLRRCRRHRRCRCRDYYTSTTSTSWDIAGITRRYFHHIMFLLPVSRVPFRCYTRACRCLRVSCCLYRGSSSSQAAGLRKLGSFRPSEQLQLRDDIVFSWSSHPKMTSACQFGIFGIFICRKLRFSVGTANVELQEQGGAPTWALNYRQNSVREGLRHTVRIYCRLCVSVIEAKTASGSLTTHGLTLCHRLVKRLILLYHIISSIFRRIFSPDIQYIYASLSFQHTHLNGVNN